MGVYEELPKDMYWIDLNIYPDAESRIAEAWRLLADDVRAEMVDEGIISLPDFIANIKESERAKFLYDGEDRFILGYWSATGEEGGFRYFGHVVRGLDFKPGDKVKIAKVTRVAGEEFFRGEPERFKRFFCPIPEDKTRLIKHAVKFGKLEKFGRVIVDGIRCVLMMYEKED